MLEEYDAEAASGAFPNDPGGVLRRMYHDDRGLKTLGVRAAERFTGRAVGLEHVQRRGRDRVGRLLRPAAHVRRSRSRPLI